MALVLTKGPQFMPAIFSTLLAIFQRCYYRAGNAPEPVDDLLLRLQSEAKTADLPLNRYRAARTLGVWADREPVFAFLTECLDDPESMVRQGAAESLFLLDINRRKADREKRTDGTSRQDPGQSGGGA
jgi:hypothetical protein